MTKITIETEIIETDLPPTEDAEKIKEALGEAEGDRTMIANYIWRILAAGCLIYITTILVYVWAFEPAMCAEPYMINGWQVTRLFLWVIGLLYLGYKAGRESK